MSASDGGPPPDSEPRLGVWLLAEVIGVVLVVVALLVFGLSRTVLGLTVIALVMLAVTCVCFVRASRRNMR